MPVFGRKDAVLIMFGFIADYERKLKNNADAARKANLDIFRVYTSLLAAVLLVMLILSAIEDWDHLAPLYVVGLGVTLLLGSAAVLMGRGLMKAFDSTALIYAYILLIMSFGIMVAFYVEPHGTVTTYFAVIIAFPLVILDSIIRIGAVYVAADAAFIISALLKYEAADAQTAIINCVVLSLLGLVLGGYVNMIKLNGIELRRQLKIQSYTDMLTGLGNRRSLFERLAELEGRGWRDLGVIMVDIDYFKQYNDTYGHQAGDECLRRIGGAMRKLDGGVEFFRYGGEEFLGLCPGGSESEMAATARRLALSVKDVYPYGPGNRVTLSFGCAAGDDGSEKCITRADMALYAAKARGRDKVVRFSECGEQDIRQSFRDAR